MCDLLPQIVSKVSIVQKWYIWNLLVIFVEKEL